MNSQDVVRKLTTIMAADVAGYSRMMSDDEENTLRTFRLYFKIIEGLIAKHGGRIFNTAGDAILAEFDSAVECVRCTISIQEELNTRNSGLAPEKQIRFRIGVNVGDVMIEGDDLFGDGVNVAARLEGIAQPGGICISASTFEQVKNKLSIGFQDLGPQDVKNIPHPVDAFQIMAGPISVAPNNGQIHIKGQTTKPPKTMGRRPVVMALSAAGLAALIGGGLLMWRRSKRQQGQPARKSFGFRLLRRWRNN